MKNEAKLIGGPLCKTVEEYANERALEASIKMAIKLGATKGQIIDNAAIQFPDMPKEYITTKIDELY